MIVTPVEVITLLVLVFGGISVVGALHRIRDSNEKAVELLERIVAQGDRGDPAT